MLSYFYGQFLIDPGWGRGRGWVQSLCMGHATGNERANAEEGSPILETALIASELGLVFLSHAGSTTSHRPMHPEGQLPLPATLHVHPP